MNNIRSFLLLISAVSCGIVVGRLAKHIVAPSVVIATSPATKKFEETSNSTPPGFVARYDASKKILSVEQMNEEAAKVWHTDHTYMRNMWFGGDQLRINKVNDIIRKDFCEFPRRIEAREAKRRFTEVESEEEKRYYYHEWTYARLYEMIRVLEVAKIQNLLAHVDPPPSPLRKEHPTVSNPGAKPKEPQTERALDKVFQ